MLKTPVTMKSLGKTISSISERSFSRTGYKIYSEERLKADVWSDSKELYRRANDYWSSQDLSIQSMLGGFGHMHDRDIFESSLFLDSILSQYSLQNNWALDCGAGIGRVSKHLLVSRFKSIDLADQCQKFMDYAPEFIGSDRVKNLFVKGAQDLKVEPHKYNLIWIQWMLSQLTDTDLLKFLNHIKLGLRHDGVLIIKENLPDHGRITHKEDFSVTRNEQFLKEYFDICGLKILCEDRQVSWPSDLLQVKMFALIDPSSSSLIKNQLAKTFN